MLKVLKYLYKCFEIEIYLLFYLNNCQVTCTTLTATLQSLTQHYITHHCTLQIVLTKHTMLNWIVTLAMYL